MIWDLGSNMASQLFNSWNTALLLTWDCPRATRTYLVQNVLSCGFSSARTDILARYVKFFKGLLWSASWEVRYLARLVSRDRSTVTSCNLRMVEEASGLDPWVDTADRIGAAVKNREMVGVPDTDRWRLKYLASLLQQRMVAKYITNEEEEEQLSKMIESLAI